MDEDIKVLHKADPAFQETLISEVIPDPMEGEQTWPTEEELREAGYLIICYYMAHVTPWEIVRSMIGSTSYPGFYTLPPDWLRRSYCRSSLSRLNIWQTLFDIQNFSISIAVVLI